MADAQEAPLEERPAAVPAPSATVLLLRERNHGVEVLMVKRGEGGDFGSALVFPGGKMDAGDRDEAWLELVGGARGLDAEQRGLRIAGWREVFEETGLLPVACAAGLAPGERGGGFVALVRRSGARLPLDQMQPFARWITPRFAARRFDTHFFLCGLDDEAVCDGFETVSAEWVRPADAIAMGAAGERKLLFPTRSQLRRLLEVNSIEEAFAVATAQPVTPIEPRRERRAEGVFVTIPPDAGYAVFEEALEGPQL